VLQVKDFADHEMSHMHKESLELASAPPVASTSSSCGPSTSPESSCPTAALIRLSIEEFSRKAELASRSDPMNFPPALCDRQKHGKMIQAIALVLPPGRLLRFNEDRELLEKKK
ncbi:unnamed protein product, partial [Symbiodinium sp. CCMP2592]